MSTQDTLVGTPEVITPAPTAASALEAMDEAGSAVIAPETQDTPDDVAETEGTEGTEGEDATEAAFEVDIALPNRGEDGPPEKVRLAVPDQKTADALRFAQNQVAKVGKLEARLQQAEEAEAIIAAIDRDPVAAMQQLASDPKVSEAFARDYVRENYLTVAAFLKEMGLTVSYAEGTSPRTLEVEAKLAATERERRLEKAQQSTRTSSVQQAFQSRAKAVVDGLAQTLTFGDEDDRDLFYRATSDKLAKLYHSNPHATPAEQTAALQGLVQKFAGKPTTTIKTKVLPRDPEGRFQAAKAMNGKMAKIAGGQSGLTPALPDFDPNESLLAFTERLEGKRR